MPSQETLERFIAVIESNKHDQAIEEFYSENSTMQENQLPLRTGKALHLASERKMLARAQSIKSECIRPAFVAGDLIIEERFFYDPAQRVPK